MAGGCLHFEVQIEVFPFTEFFHLQLRVKIKLLWRLCLQKWKFSVMCASPSFSQDEHSTATNYD